MISSEDLQDAIIQEVKNERDTWKDALAHVTENVSLKTRDLIRTLRKNYWGIYDNPKDPTTGRRKIWVPLTEQLVETGVKQTDFDTKDVRFRATNPKGIPFTQISRGLAGNYLDKTYFGQDLNVSNRQLNIDGTFVWKTVEKDGMPTRTNVDLLNFFIDPTADNIQDTARVTERILMTPEEVKSHSTWVNTDGVEGDTGLEKTYETYTDTTADEQVKYVDVWEMWGLVPEYFITGNKEDKKQVEAHIVVSGFESGEPTFHYAARNTNKDAAGNIIKPYEECRATKVQNRWYGRGIAEKVMMLQLWINTTVNIRINRSFLTQMGIFKIRKGSGITPDQLKNLPQNGGIVVNSMDDIENFAMQDVAASSYTEEQKITDWAQRVTSAYDVVAGEALPAETPATNASIQNQNAKSTFSLVKENIGMFLQRWMDRHAMPIIAKNTSTGDIIKISGDDEEIRRAFDRAVAYRAKQEFDAFETEVFKTNFRKPEEVDEAIKKVEKLQEQVEQTISKLQEEPDVFAEVYEEVTTENLETRVYFTNEETDPSVQVSQLLNMLQVAPEYKNEIVREAFNLMNLDIPSTPRQPQAQMRSPEQMSPESRVDTERQARTQSPQRQRRRQPQSRPNVPQ